MKRLRTLLRIALLLLLLVLSTIMASDAFVTSSAKGRIFSDTTTLPHRRVGLVLGTGKKVVGGRPNLFFKYRMEAAAELFKTGRVDFLLVSGDNGSRYYDETSDMKKDLVARGVPAGKIYGDYAGFRTLDSMVRAKKVFGLNECTVISQQFHCERAAFLGAACGLDVIGFAAKDVPARFAVRAWFRERLARVAAMLDVFVWQRGPRFLGPQVVIGAESPPER